MDKKQLRIKVITGFRKDQHYSISAEEAHKAYYLFLHPEKRGVFSNGLALIGKHIQEIQPDYNGSMGWNETHNLSGDDWNELRKKGIDTQIRELMQEGRKIGSIGKPELLNLPLSEVAQQGLVSGK